MRKKIGRIWREIENERGSGVKGRIRKRVVYAEI